MRCMGCMEMHDGSHQVCPYCGFDESEYKKIGYHLPLHTTLVDTYIVGKALGYGGFGVTYVGYNAILEIKVAIKEYLPGEFATRGPEDTAVRTFSGDKELAYYKGLSRCEEEAKKLSKLRNQKGIVEIYDCFKANNTVYIVMECLEGETVKDVLNREKKLSVKKATDIAIAVLETLKNIHNGGIIHRDISPENIFLTNTGEVKLIDFGAARNATTSMSKSLSVIIKQGYAPPEQYFSKGGQGSWTDVYATAATYYKMLTGITPEDSMERKLEDKLVPPSKLGVKLSKSRENALLNALELDIDNRTATASEFAKAITMSGIRVKRRKTKIQRTDIGKISKGLKIIICLAMLVIVISFAIGYNLTRDNVIIDDDIVSDNQVYVPNVLNMSFDEAEKLLEEYRLVAVRGNWVSSDDAVRDTVMYQDILPGQVVEEGTEIHLGVCSGGVNSQIGEYVGISKEEAIRKLDELHIYAEFDEVYSPVAQGCVVSQNVSGDETIRRGNEVKIEISKGMVSYGAGETVVPDLTNMALEDVISLMGEKELYVKVIERNYNDKVHKGCVVSQNYTPGDIITKGTVIEVEISEGVELITIPDFKFTKAEDYMALLVEMGMECSIGYVDGEEYVQVQPGYVADLNVDVGEKYPIGSPVIIYERDGVLFKAEVTNLPERERNYFKVGDEINLNISITAHQGSTPASWKAKFVLNYDDEMLQFSRVEGNVNSEIIDNRIKGYESSLILGCGWDEKDHLETIQVTFVALKEGNTDILVSDYAYPFDQGFDSGFIVNSNHHYDVYSETAQSLLFTIE